MVAAAGGVEGATKYGALRPLVKTISAQTCLKERQVYDLLGALRLERDVLRISANAERPQPSILVECLPAPDPLALACRALEEEWTAEQVRQEAARLRAAAAAGDAPPSVPEGRYHTLVVDPPWDYGNKSGRHGVPYRTLTLADVCAFDIGRWVAEDFCHLYLWVTDAYAGDVYQVTRAWGFEPKAWLIWQKDRIGMGNYFRHQHEACVFATRGKQRLKRMDASTLFRAPTGAHSAKPDAFYSLVETCSFAPYLDVFARRHRAGWDVFGDEVTSPAYQLRLCGDNQSGRR